jgi:hypothetical protein
MNRFAPLFAASLLAGATSFAQNSAVQSVEVRGSVVRTDVRALCPDVDAGLHDALVKTVQQVATAATMDVRFELSGNRIDDVATGDGPLAYQRMLKRAVRGLQCDSGSATPQTVALRVRFVDPFDRSTRSTDAGVVLLSASAVAR